MLLKQALLNVLDNAVKYTDAPGRVDVCVEQAPDGEGKRRLRFCVKDSGIGMSPEFLPKAFDLFSQEDPSFTTRYGGSGMGLTVARQKIQLLGGEISAESRKNEGSVFTVAVSLQMADRKDEESPFGSVSLEGRRVLIVEDIPDNAEICAELLEAIHELRAMGFVVEMDDFGSGYSSLNMLSSMPIDVLKMDMSFVRNIEKSETDMRLATLIVDIAKNLNLHVIAEGVERAGQLSLLKNAGCDLVQGYYFSRPLPAEEFEKLIERELKIERKDQA